MFKSKIRTLLKRVVSTAAAAVMMATTVIPSAAAKDIEYDWTRPVILSSRNHFPQ